MAPSCCSTGHQPVRTRPGCRSRRSRSWYGTGPRANAGPSAVPDAQLRHLGRRRARCARRISTAGKGPSGPPPSLLIRHGNRLCCRPASLLPVRLSAPESDRRQPWPRSLCYNAAAAVAGRGGPDVSNTATPRRTRLSHRGSRSSSAPCLQPGGRGCADLLNG